MTDRCRWPSCCELATRASRQTGEPEGRGLEGRDLHRGGTADWPELNELLCQPKEGCRLRVGWGWPRQMMEYVPCTKVSYRSPAGSM